MTMSTISRQNAEGVAGMGRGIPRVFNNTGLGTSPRKPGWMCPLRCGCVARLTAPRQRACRSRIVDTKSPKNARFRESSHDKTRNLLASVRVEPRVVLPVEQECRAVHQGPHQILGPLDPFHTDEIADPLVQLFLGRRTIENREVDFPNQGQIVDLGIA